MPRYFFNVCDGQDLPDDSGTELADRNAAHRQAIWEMHVTDEAGQTVCRLNFSAEDCD